MIRGDGAGPALTGGSDLLDAQLARLAARGQGLVLGALVDREPLHGAAADLSVHSVVEIGSVTKVFTATLLAEAVVRGELGLDTPVREVLPEGTVVPTRDGVEITLEHLATHTSGLPRSPAGISTLGGTWDVVRGRDPYVGFGPDDLLAGLASSKLGRTPGTGWPKYSNAGFGLLGVALAHARGTTYDDLVAERVCRPLGLADTVTPVTATQRQRERWAAGHSRRGREVEDWSLPGIAGAGALRSTVADLLTFLRHQVDPGGSPLEDAIRLTQQPRVRHGRAGIGLGWQRFEKDGLLWHNGGTGGFRSLVAVLPGSRLATVALTNRSRSVDILGLRLLRDLAELAQS